MNSPNEIAALLQLIEDPDQEVFAAVSHRILSYGVPIIPNLEDLWMQTADAATQQRIEELIHRLHFAGLMQDFNAWATSPHQELLPAALLEGKLIYPDLQAARVIRDVERLRRNIWLELNNYLTPLEQITVFNNIFYNYFGLRGHYAQNNKPEAFLLHKVIEHKRGNQSGNGLLFLVLAELLDLPVRLLPIPGYFVLAWFKSQAERELEKLHLNIEFYIDPVSGQPFSHTDLSAFFKRIELAPVPAYFHPCRNDQVIAHHLTELQRCFGKKNKLYLSEAIGKLVQLLTS